MLTFVRVVVICVSVGLLACGGQPEIGIISPEDLYARTKTADAPLILDVRAPEEFRTGHIQGAVNIPHTELASRLGELETRNGVVVHCMVGPRARLGEAILVENGVRNVSHLDGGLAAWKESGLPVQVD
jgi:rhodanese-related sulfurtransferase